MFLNVHKQREVKFVLIEEIENEKFLFDNVGITSHFLHQKGLAQLSFNINIVVYSIIYLFKDFQRLLHRNMQIQSFLKWQVFFEKNQFSHPQLTLAFLQLQKHFHTIYRVI